jgi:hypothetical protein
MRLVWDAPLGHGATVTVTFPRVKPGELIDVMADVVVLDPGHPEGTPQDPYDRAAATTTQEYER